MTERLHHGVIAYATSPRPPDWLHDINWKAYLDRYNLRESGSPFFVNETRIIDHVAGSVIEKALSFPENTGKKGVVLAIGHRGDLYIPPVAVKYGEINASDPEFINKLNKYTYYALFKSHFLIQHTELFASQQNLKLPEGEVWKIDNNNLPGGAIAFKNGVVLGVSGLATGEQDSALVLAIGVKAHLVRPQVAAGMAKDIGFAREYQKFI
ncbi:MAG: hypothetical protein HYV90_05845 [Candidatus Woesebacteria bacterium]|nr:MAG: hypothetical protein HYV90_05845 [Candidatus Woesebacteria bacterium]